MLTDNGTEEWTCLEDTSAYCQFRTVQISRKNNSVQWNKVKIAKDAWTALQKSCKSLSCNSSFNWEIHSDGSLRATGVLCGNLPCDIKFEKTTNSFTFHRFSNWSLFQLPFKFIAIVSLEIEKTNREEMLQHYADYTKVSVFFVGPLC